MHSHLYVRNLSQQTTERELHDLFAQVGEVIATTLVMERFTARPCGYSYIEMESEQAAEEAVQLLDGKVFEGRPLEVLRA